MLGQKVSLVIPVFNESESIEILYKQITEVFSKFKKYIPEIIFINDGSTDETPIILKKLQNKDKKIIIINFQNNLGKTQALKMGFRKAEGQIIATIDSDLQDDPKNLPKLIKKLDEGYDLVVGWRKERKDPEFKKFISQVFNLTLQISSGLPLHDFNCGLKVIKKNVAKAIPLFGNSHRFIPVIAYKMGFKVGEEAITHRKRLYGKSKYGSSKFFTSIFDFVKVQFYSTKRPFKL